MKTLIRNANVWQKGKFLTKDVLVDGERIAVVGKAARRNTMRSRSGWNGQIPFAGRNRLSRAQHDGLRNETYARLLRVERRGIDAGWRD